MVLVLRRCLRILSVRTALCIIPSLLWLVLIHVELGNCPVPGARNVLSSTPVLCNVSHLYTKGFLVVEATYNNLQCFN